MARRVSGKLWGTLMLGLALTAKADGPPPLVGPGEQLPPPLPPPSASESTKPVNPPPSDSRPVLALPGLTAPSSRTSRTSRPVAPASSLSPDQTDALPPLISPNDRVGSGSGTSPTLDPLPSQPLSSQRFRPRVVESMPSDAKTNQRVTPRSSPLGSDSAGNFSTTRRLPEGTNVRDLPAPKAYDDATSGRSRMLNMFFPPRGPRPPADSSISTEPRTDPAADATLKKRIERQAAQAVGQRVKEIDIRVVGRVINIEAKGVRFLQRRSVKRSLESLPALSGYKAIVEVRD